MLYILFVLLLNFLIPFTPWCPSFFSFGRFIVFGGIVFFVFLGSVLFSKTTKHAFPKKFLKPLYLFIGFALLRSLFASAVSYRIILLGFLVGFFFILFYYLWPILKNLKAYEKLLNTITIFSLTIFLPTFIFFILGKQQGWMMGRFRGILSNSNQLGVSIAILAPLLLASSIMEKKFFLKYLLRLIISFTFLAILISGSRSGVIAFTIGMVCFFILDRHRSSMRHTLFAVLLLLIFLIVLLLFYDTVVGSLGLIWSSVYLRGETTIEAAANTRMVQLHNAFSVTKRHELSGLGWGGVIKEEFTFRSLQETFQNSYIQIYVATGIIGCILALFLFKSIIFYIIRAVRKVSLPVRSRIIANGFIAAIAAGLTNAVFESWLFVPSNYASIIFWVSVIAVIKISMQPETIQD